MPTNKPPPLFSITSSTAVHAERWAPVLEPEAGWLATWRSANLDPATATGLIGVDEAGRGPLAGPVCAAAVILPEDVEIDGLTDSKQLKPARRTALADVVRSQALGWALGWATAAEIDALNILAATHLAMARAVTTLGRKQAVVLVDGNRTPRALGACWQVASVIKGDGRIAEISAASVLAKTARDAKMVELDGLYPGYAFAEHKGYPTRDHLERLRSLGPCPEHRRSFAPVRALEEQGELVL